MTPRPKRKDDSKRAVSVAKERLDRLIRKGRADLYKPIAIAEILFRNRVEKNVSLENKEDYRRRSYEWMRLIIADLHGKTTSLNSRYWDQIFDDDVMPPRVLMGLGRINAAGDGIVETYIYEHVRGKFAALARIQEQLKAANPSNFKLSWFLNAFERDSRFKRSVDKAYEIVVYALFSAVVSELRAEVSLSVDPSRLIVLKDFEDFSRMVLGVDVKHPSVTHPARLFRVGTANANDAGLDMWANFGPAVQVKHMSLSPDQVGDICQVLQADQIVVVCKKADASAIAMVIKQLGLEDKLRGMITERDLHRWYEVGFSARYQASIGRNVLDGILREMVLEFPLSDSSRMERFFNSRKYDISSLKGEWAVKN